MAAISVALNNLNNLYKTKLATKSLRGIVELERDCNRVNIDLHLYYIALAAGNTAVTTAIETDLKAIFNDYDLVLDTPLSIGGGGSGVVPVAGIWDWDGTNHDYQPYSAAQAFLSFDNSTSNPTLTGRLNLNGHLHATRMYGANIDLLDGGSFSLRRQVPGTDTDGDVKLRADATGFYGERYSGGAWNSFGIDITF